MNIPESQIKVVFIYFNQGIANFVLPQRLILFAETDNFFFEYNCVNQIHANYAQQHYFAVNLLGVPFHFVFKEGLFKVKNYYDWLDCTSLQIQEKILTVIDTSRLLKFIDKQNRLFAQWMRALYDGNIHFIKNNEVAPGSLTNTVKKLVKCKFISRLEV